MDAAPYYAPTYFPASYFYSADVTDTILSPGLLMYNAPTYFAPTYFYGPSSSSTSTTSTAELLMYNAPTYFAPAYFYGPSSASTSTTSTTGPSPFNAPTYFASAYFYGSPSTSTVSTTGLLPYNAPTYFAPTYFYGPSSGSVIAPVLPDTAGCDHDSYLTLMALLQATGLFEGVIFGAATERGQAGADTYPLAVLTPRGWDESDDFDPASIVRRATFAVTVVVASRDGLPPFDQLNRLSCAIKKAVDGSSLDGTCLPALTRIRSGHYDYSNHYPEHSIDLEGEFTSIVEPAANALASS